MHVSEFKRTCATKVEINGHTLRGTEHGLCTLIKKGPLGPFSIGGFMEIKLRNVTLNYVVEGQGKPLLLIHGNQENLDIFDALSKALKSNYTVYRMDLRNHGKSEHHVPLSYDLMAEDIFWFIQRLNIEKPSVFGFSDGGIIGLMLVINHPTLVEKLMIAGTNTRPNGMRYKVVKAMERKFLETKSMYYQLMITQPFIKKKALRSIQVPVLSFLGEKDLILRKHAKMIVKQLPHAQLTIIPKARHEDYIVHNDLLAPHIKAFLE